MSNNLVLSSKVGKFIFYPDVIKSHAKLIRDAVMDQILQPRSNGMKIRNSADATRYVKASCNGSYSETPFSFIPTPKTGVASSGRR